ncbi:pyruvoyl-dependent arginine decarboxylase [Haloarchaeobius sp. HRN-SO-5]|uniref:pyruvoyl-dependent arginine decarboxylase n=1 Tax=Haloarchaeobius sp. HRN-SO-5 TaxID=3446118 RepID=UPI003EBCDAE8
MEPIRIVWGHATGPTELSSYDAALAEAGVENYNLVSVSSVIPGGATVEMAGNAPDLGDVGDRLTVVEARATTTEPGHVAAGLAWSQSPDGGLFYEAAEASDEDEVEERIQRGMAAGQALRDWSFGETHVCIESTSVEPGTYTTAVVLAVYGDGDPIL